MKRCDKLVDVGRRKFLTGASWRPLPPRHPQSCAAAKAAPARPRVNYPSNRSAMCVISRSNEPIKIAYPDEDSPGVLIKLGRRVVRRRTGRRHRRVLHPLPA